MDIVTLGAALNGSAEYVNSHFKGGSNIQIVNNPDGTQTINASGEVSSEDTVARAEIADIKDGETLDSFGDVETALGDKADEDNVYKLALSNADLLPANTDLDDVKTVGCYYVLASAIVPTITHRPTENASAFRVTVELAAGTIRPRQIYQEYNSYDKYIRTENSSGVFGGWKKVEGDLSTIYTKTEVDTALSGKVDKETGKGLSTNDYTTAEKTKLEGIAEGAEVNVQANWTQTTTTADDYIKNKPTLGTAAAKNATDTYNSTGDDVTTGKAVAAALATLPEPMIFKGSLGTGGTITILPTASSSNKGYTYKVITAGTYASQSAKVGDTFISDGSAWVLIPSGDEPSGTVTNVAVANGGGLTVSGSPITTSGTITVGHSNSVTAKTSSSLKKFTYDAYGHVTGSSELSTAESNALASGIDSEKVAQIETNKNNILTVADQTTQYNVCSANSWSMTGIGASPKQIIVPISTGTYRIIATVSRTDTSKAIQFRIGYTTEMSVENRIDILPAVATENYISNEFTLTSPAVCVDFWANTPSDVTQFAIIPKAIYDAGFTNYQPYALGNTELTTKEQQNENNILTVAKTGGAKNVLYYNLAYLKNINTGGTWSDNVYTRGNATFTLNSDGTISVETTGTPNNALLFLRISVPNAYGTQVISGTPTGGGTINVEQSASPYSLLAQDQGNGATIPNNTAVNINIYIRINSELSDTVIFKPMICSNDDWSISHDYQTGAMSNAEITAWILSQS